MPNTPHRNRSARLGLAALVALPIVEIVIVIVVGQWIGLWVTIGLLLAGLMAGVVLTRRGGRTAWRSLVEGLQSGGSGAEALAEPALVMLGGVALMVPGYLTDLVGVALLLPFTRPYARRLLRQLASRQVERHLGMSPDLIRAHLDPTRTVPGDLIPGEGEVISEEGDGADTDRPTVIRGEVER